MRRIGRVLHISPGGKAVVKAERIPRIGEPVADEAERLVGTVFDVLGSTVSPYVEVAVKVKEPQSMVDQVLYVSSPKRKSGSRRKA